MKGILEKTTRGWVVKKIEYGSDEAKFITTYPLHESDASNMDEAVRLGTHGEVEFELVMGINNVFNTTEPFAKIWKPMFDLDKLKAHLDSLTPEQLAKDREWFQKCEMEDCPHCAEDIAQMQDEDDDLTDDEWLIKEKHKHILNFAVWFKESDWDCYDNTDRGNLYANPLVTDSLLTIEEIYELYLKEV